jgi:hypothetical protein
VRRSELTEGLDDCGEVKAAEAFGSTTTAMLRRSSAETEDGTRTATT